VNGGEMSDEDRRRRFCLNLSTLDSADLETQLRVSRDAGFHAVGLREKHVASYLMSGGSPLGVRKMLDSHGLVAVEYDFFPNWVCAGSGERESLRGRFDRFCEVAADTGCAIVVAPTSTDDGAGELDWHTAAGNLRAMARVAAAYELTVGVEFLPWSSLDTVTAAWELVRRSDCGNAAIVLDTFHYFEGPNSRDELWKVPVEAIALCHVDDVEAVEADVVTRCRRHRVFPGEGIYEFREILSYLSEHSYHGYYSLEIMNASHATQDPGVIAREAMASLDRLFGG
jgi:4-hydroxyphenylpyruvate dioxygenase